MVRTSHVLVAIGAITLVLGGCTLNPRIFGYDEEATALPDNEFVVRLNPERTRTLGGAGSSGVKDYVEHEVAQKGICKAGVIILGENQGRGYYYVRGRCR